MKIEFVQREDVDNTMWYFTRSNENYISGSGFYNKGKAHAFFKQFVKQTNKKPIETILETIEIDVQ